MHVDIVIITPKEDEFAEIRHVLHQGRALISKSRRIQFDFATIQGEHYDWQVAVVDADQGDHPFALKTNEVIQELRPDYIILAGTAAGLKDVQIGDILIADAAANYESGKETEHGFENRPQIINNTSLELLPVAKIAMRDWQNKAQKDPTKPNCYKGLIVSGDKVLADINSETVGFIRQHYGQAKGVEMEAHDFAQAAFRGNLPYLNIRGISDMIAHKGQSDKQGNRKIASFRVKEFLKELIQILPAPIKIPVHESQINYTTQKLSLTSIRSKNKARISIFDKQIVIHIDEGQDILIRSLNAVQRIVMPGDIAKNWIAIEYQDHHSLKHIYISDAANSMLGPWTGGSKKLFQVLDNFHKNSIRLS